MNKDTLQDTLRKNWSFPKSDIVKRTVDSFSLTEKVLFYFFLGLLVLSAGTMLYQVNQAFMVEVPAHGGKLSEGVIGTPRFINPVLALSDTDRDLTTLIYSGLLKATPEGELIGDLAEQYEISEDGKVYTFTLRENAHFHDGSKVTTEDVEFTILQAQDSALKSPRRANWDGVIVEKINERTIRFTLKQPYGPFLENATIGILPKHIWRNTDTDEFSFSRFNIEAIGSGPYRIAHIEKDSEGIPTLYTLTAFKKYALGEPFIKNIDIHFYSNEEEITNAFKKGYIESFAGISPAGAEDLEKKGATLYTAVLPRIFAVFFNQNQSPVFLHKEVRVALDEALDKERIVNEVLSGYGEVLSGPIPGQGKGAPQSTSTLPRTEQALATLTNAGWKLNPEKGYMEKKTTKETIPLKFSIATADAKELVEAARLIQEDWQKIGAQVEVLVFETGDLNQTIIRPRRYDALFFGEIIGRDLDLYPFWHSSQRNDPGLNIAMFVNNTADKLIEEARMTSDTRVRNEKHALFVEEIGKDRPASFVYSPHFLYVVPDKVKHVSLGSLTIPGERFLGIHKWYIETNNIWKIFIQ